jgi:hypothetical protein
MSYSFGFRLRNIDKMGVLLDSINFVQKLLFLVHLQQMQLIFCYSCNIYRTSKATFCPRFSIFAIFSCFIAWSTGFDLKISTWPIKKTFHCSRVYFLSNNNSVIIYKLLCNLHSYDYICPHNAKTNSKIRIIRIDAKRTLFYPWLVRLRFDKMILSFLYYPIMGICLDDDDYDTNTDV